MVQEQNLEMDMQEETDSRYLTFWLDKQRFGVPITEVVQIIGMQEITELPEHPVYVKGIISLRGQVIPAIDVRLRIGKLEAAYDEKTCMIILSVENTDFGFIVDEVDEVMDISPENISEAPKISKERVNTYLTGIGRVQAGQQKESIILLMNAARMLEKDEVEMLAQAAEE